MGAVTYLDPNREAHTYRFELLALYGAKLVVLEHLQYALKMVGHLLGKQDAGASSAAGGLPALAAPAPAALNLGNPSHGSGGAYMV